ncbi:MAG: hypothetical protein KF773_31475 [Deltaproteobacteria bacterium]|nr:hypothetical protein [Deltaproteobacteria bacterium]
MKVTTVAASTTAVRTFRCRRCGHEQDAEVVGLGEGVQSFLNASGTAERRAAEDAQRGLDRTIARARCPSCKLRNPGVMAGFAGVFVAIAAGTMLVAIVLGFYPTWSEMNMSEHDKAICRWLMPAIFGGVLAIVLPIELLKRWPRDAYVRWLPPR